MKGLTIGMSEIHEVRPDSYEALIGALFGHLEPGFYRVFDGWLIDEARFQMNTASKPTITVELVNEPGQPAWWQASFHDYHGAGPHPADALDNLIEVIT